MLLELLLVATLGSEPSHEPGSSLSGVSKEEVQRMWNVDPNKGSLWQVAWRTSASPLNACSHRRVGDLSSACRGRCVIRNVLLVAVGSLFLQSRQPVANPEAPCPLLPLLIALLPFTTVTLRFENRFTSRWSSLAGAA